MIFFFLLCFLSWKLSHLPTYSVIDSEERRNRKRVDLVWTCEISYSCPQQMQYMFSDLDPSNYSLPDSLFFPSSFPSALSLSTSSISFQTGWTQWSSRSTQSWTSPAPWCPSRTSRYNYSPSLSPQIKLLLSLSGPSHCCQHVVALLGHMMALLSSLHQCQCNAVQTFSMLWRSV